MQDTEISTTIAPRAGVDRRFMPFFVCLTLVLTFLLAWAARTGIPKGTITRFDFRSMYAAGIQERTDPAHLYDPAAQQSVQIRYISEEPYPLPFFHPGYEAFLYVPFSFLPYSAAWIAFLTFNVILTGACLLAGSDLFSVTIPLVQPRPGLMLFLYVPLYIALLQGQDSILFLLILILVLKRIEAGRNSQAGLLLALALFKFQIILPMAFLLTVRKGRRVAWGFAVGAAAAILLTLASSGGSVRPFLNLVQHSAAAGQASQMGEGYIFPWWMANFRGLVFALTGGHLSSAAMLATVLPLSVFLLAAVALRIRHIESERLAFAAAVMACVLTSFHLYAHDLMTLLLPIAAMAAALPIGRLPLIFSLLLMPLASLAASRPPLFLMAIPLTAATVLILLPLPARSPDINGGSGASEANSQPKKLSLR